jgi:hypothetical protein
MLRKFVMRTDIHRTVFIMAHTALIEYESPKSAYYTCSRIIASKSHNHRRNSFYGFAVLPQQLCELVER